MRGFTDYKIVCVIKFGGSILQDQTLCQNAIDEISQLARKGYRLMLIPGGGPTDKTIEALDQRHPFDAQTHHKACARAQDQTGLMICDSLWNGKFRACETLEEVIEANDQGCVAVLLPSRLIFDLNPFERTWDITSDAMSVYFSWLVGAKHTIILSDVDGIYKDGDIGNPKKLIKEISATALESMGHTAVDVCTPAFLASKKMECLVMNATHSNQIEKYLLNQREDLVGTLIYGDNEMYLKSITNLLHNSFRLLEEIEDQGAFKVAYMEKLSRFKDLKAFNAKLRVIAGHFKEGRYWDDEHLELFFYLENHTRLHQPIEYTTKKDQQ